MAVPLSVAWIIRVSRNRGSPRSGAIAPPLHIQKPGSSCLANGVFAPLV
ncbi:MAG: hypothetical protein KME27_30385 [Lyngbya sp. HA4199-MV5]|nr:hypothetical protein [Lyngbya sp. HA4199-MV5]